MRFSDFFVSSAALAGAKPWTDGALKDLKDFAMEKLIDLTPFDSNRFQLKSPQDLLTQFNSTSSPGPDVAAPDASAGDRGPRPAGGKTNNHASNPSKTDDNITSNPSTQGSGSCTNPTVRLEWRNMTDQGRRDYMAAARCLIDRPSQGPFKGSHNRYEDLVWVHQQMSEELHGFAQFLPWHRRYLQVYETALRDECGYRGPMTWWDEARDAGNFAKAPLFSPQYFGSAPLRTQNGQGGCVTDGAFAGITLHIGPGGGFDNHCLSRAVDESLTAEVSQATVDTVHSQDNFPSFAGLVEGWPHAYGHNGIGAVMSDVGPAPGDPVFFLHHAFIDRNWWRWQNVDRNSRVYQISGKVNSRNQNITLDYVLGMKGIQKEVKVTDMMDTQGKMLCYTYDY